MKRRFRKTLCCLLAAVISLGMLGGCGKDNGGKSVIEVMTWHGKDTGTNYYDGYEQAAKDYMVAHKDVEIKIRYEDEKNYGSILETGFAGNTAPEIIQMLSGQRGTFRTNLMDLREILSGPSAYAKDSATWADTFIGGIGAFPVEDNGENTNGILFIPNDENPSIYTGGIYVYNKKLIKDAGLDPENPPKTWTDLFQWLEALSKLNGVAPIAGNNDVGGKVSQLGGLFGEDYADRFFEGDVVDPEFANDLFTDKLYVLTCYDKGDGMPLDNLPYYPAMFKLMKQHLSYYQTSWTENSGDTEMLTFANAKAAMMMSNFWGYNTLLKSMPEDKFPDGFGTFKCPYLGEDTLDYAVSMGWITKEEADSARPYAVTRTRSVGGSGQVSYGFCVNKSLEDDPEKLAAAIDFLQFLSSPEEQAKYVETAKSISPVKGVEFIDIMKEFMLEEPEGGFAERILGYMVVEWGKSGWDVDLMNFLKGNADWETTVETISEPMWAADIPTLETLQSNVDAAQAEVDSASPEEKAVKERALKFARLRKELYEKYYYNMTGNLTER